jgi:hypothetical protein
MFNHPISDMVGFKSDLSPGMYVIPPGTTETSGVVTTSEAIRA